MSVLHKISAAKSRRNSLSEQFHMAEEICEVLEEAKIFIQRQNSTGFPPSDDFLLLCSLRDLLENSLVLAKSAAEQTNFERRSNETWAASGPQGRQHQKMLQMSKLASAMEMGTIHEEPHEQQCKNGVGTMPKIEPNGKEIVFDDELDQKVESFVHIEEIEDTKELFLINLLAHIALIASVICWLLIGSLVFRLIDTEIGAKSFPRSVIWCFQLLTTIGWGDSRASNSLSQAFTLLYILIGIPMLFSAFANLGRTLTEYCCVLWPKILKWLRKILKREEEISEASSLLEAQRMPMMPIIILFILHNVVGLLIYSVWLKQWPIISAIYFSITTMATSGFGDYHPDTDSWMEVIVAMVYLSVGIVLLSALFLTIALHYQLFHHVFLKVQLAKAYYQLANRWHKTSGHNAKSEIQKQ
ncbi:hypothetical protein niasHT_037369 [Heterodera trifolii]|uniref:Potassium channel domain-containing protein n=1 Tax=Heterodera trifolii TaxID=157864 RepID=A0ABD2J6C2_9BILA